MNGWRENYSDFWGFRCQPVKNVHAGNYMAFKNNRIRLGKLLMNDTDLILIDTTKNSFRSPVVGIEFFRKLIQLRYCAIFIRPSGGYLFLYSGSISSIRLKQNRRKAGCPPAAGLNSMFRLLERKPQSNLHHAWRSLNPSEVRPVRRRLSVVQCGIRIDRKIGAESR